MGKHHKKHHKHHKSSHSIGHLFKSGGNLVKNSVGDVYKDVKGAVKYTGKHLIKDVDKVSSTLSNPMLYIGIAVVGIIFLTTQKR